jgi:hypothetical protein
VLGSQRCPAVFLASFLANLSDPPLRRGDKERNGAAGDDWHLSESVFGRNDGPVLTRRSVVDPSRHAEKSDENDFKMHRRGARGSVAGRPGPTKFILQSATPVLDDHEPQRTLARYTQGAL